MDKNLSKEFDTIIKGLFRRSSREKCLNVYGLSIKFTTKMTFIRTIALHLLTSTNFSSSSPDTKRKRTKRGKGLSLTSVSNKRNR